jgi:hypothetical protein
MSGRDSPELSEFDTWFAAEALEFASDDCRLADVFLRRYLAGGELPGGAQMFRCEVAGWCEIAAVAIANEVVADVSAEPALRLAGAATLLAQIVRRGRPGEGGALVDAVLNTHCPDDATIRRFVECLRYVMAMPGLWVPRRDDIGRVISRLLGAPEAAESPLTYDSIWRCLEVIGGRLDARCEPVANGTSDRC